MKYTKHFFTSALLLFATWTTPWAQDSERRIYYFENPIHNEVSLGPVARTFHYTWLVANAAIQTAVFYSATQDIAATATYAAAGIAFKIPQSTMNTFLNLKFVSWKKAITSVAPLLQSPQVLRVFMITSRDLGIQGMQAVREESNRYVFVEVDPSTTLDPQVSAELGEPHLITHPESVFLELKLSLDSNESTTVLKMPISDLLDQESILPEVISAWTAEFRAFKAKQSQASKYLTQDYRSKVQLKGALILEGEATTELGTLGQGDEVEKILGQGHWNQFKRLVLNKKASQISIDVKTTRCGRMLESRQIE